MQQALGEPQEHSHQTLLMSLLQKELRLSDESTLQRVLWEWDEEAMAEIEEAIESMDGYARRKFLKWLEVHGFFMLPRKFNEYGIRSCCVGPFFRGHCLWCGLRERE